MVRKDFSFVEAFKIAGYITAYRHTLGICLAFSFRDKLLFNKIIVLVSRMSNSVVCARSHARRLEGVRHILLP